ncbi:hypothetical protein HF319_05570 [Xanthomonas sp. Kuri4-1]
MALLTTQIPAHSHALNASSANGDNRSPQTRGFGKNASGSATPLYAAAGTPVVMSPTSVGAAGSDQPHPNMQPYTAINFCIALQGIYPMRA